MKKKLLAKATTGKTKFIELETDNDYLVTRWGYVDGKQQETREKCEPKNVGKTNATTGAEQAILEFERKIEKKMESGYVKEKDFDATKKDELPDLSELQKQFCPCKPIAKSPKDALTGDYLADRKYNGVNIILNKDAKGKPHIYTRRIDDITDQLYQLDEIKYIFEDMWTESMLLVELIYTDNNDIEIPENLRALINKRRSPEAVKERYDEISKKGKLVPIIFDVMFWNGKFVGGETFTLRRSILLQHMRKNVPKTLTLSEKWIKHGKENKWEVFIIRKRDSKIAYTMNGKAKRTGSWKWKYEETSDFIITEVEFGKGKHANYWARFKLGQFKKDGSIHDFGYAGPGKLTIKELEEFYKENQNTDGSYKTTPYQVVEVVYRAKTKYDKLEFPVIQRIRDDKKPTECVYHG